MKKLVFGTFAMLGLLALAQPAAAQDPRFVVGSVMFNGSGCPASDPTSATVTVNANTLVVAFSQMTVPSFPGNAPALSCNVTALVRFAGGIRVNLAQVNYAGIAVAERGDNVLLTRRAFFAGRQGSNMSSRITRTGAFEFNDFALFPSIESCGRAGGTDTVGTTVQILASGPSAFLNLATIDARIELLFNVFPC